MLLLHCSALLLTIPARRPKRVCNVLSAEFGAAGDNVSEDTAAVRRAVNTCGGGRGSVLLPAGHTFLLRPIELPSSTTLVVDGNIAGWRDIGTWPNSSSKRCPVTPYQVRVRVGVRVCVGVGALTICCVWERRHPAPRCARYRRRRI
jgi:hypothetical protein